ncbi:uncharacterized protein Nmag_3172 [Natrialba magadii ATCC 43099]|uniref:Uncharacterized protein n=1 Tax=Natrialba magadii (strain ATCC 43099 / DSM 3394 / CCM 3739 / CIP 104546 / IAM 13178 / JCM 8861 / NBRC 102185 / NCIMB 2190 / MS3) TaxID=547559 RepID=D3SRV0_NATMM|nr:hypothetical protein [Natrialba magadii]ADD06724.1 uncharacterized protein Nmag_3172 [Natrialba magadii ATCC 43099]ELY32132.1 hypothetical protein C500_04538 [Natrialba magadii ATCC 43099]
MAEETDLKQLVTEEVTEQLDVAELINGGSIEDGIDAGEVGESVGRQFGEQFGRTVGASVGAEVHETLSSAFESEPDDAAADEADGDAEDERETETETETDTADESGVIGGPTLKSLVTELAKAVKRGVETALTDSTARDSVESAAASVTEGTSLEGVVGEEDEESADEDTDEEREETGEDETDGEDVDVDEVEDEAEDGEGDRDGDGDEDDEETDTAETDESNYDAADLEDLRRDTLTDFLGVMSYEDLQSVAKEVGVKANLSRDEMTDEIIDTVTDADDAS